MPEGERIMPLHPHSPLQEKETGLRLDRVLTRRRVLLMSGAAVAPLLVACGDEEDVPEEIPDQVDPPDSPDLDPDGPGMDAPDDGLQSPEADGG
jgi:hypothetical protein